MKSIVRSTALLSGSSVASILIGLASTKVLATILHPAGYGYFGLLQSFLAVTSLMAGMGMATGVVRLGAGAAKAGDHNIMANLRAGAWLLFATVSVVAMALLLVFRKPLSSFALGDSQHSADLIWMGVALWFTVAVNVQTGILNAWHRVEALASFGVWSALFTAVATMTAVWLFRARGIAPGVVAGAVASWGASFWYLRRAAPSSSQRASLRESLRSARALLSFGAPFTASAMVGTGVQLALPIMVLHLLNTEAVAYYKAAAAISVGYLGFLVTAMGQDYYPRLAAVRQMPERMLPLIHQQYRLVMLLAAPMILLTLALVPYLVPLIYSRRFMPAIAILEWQLIGDLFKFSSWTMSFAILARCKPILYFCTELMGGALTFGTTWLGVRMLGLAGLGLAFVATYSLYYLAVRTVLRRELPLRETAGNMTLMFAALLAAFVIRILPITRLAAYRTGTALILAIVFAAFSARTLWRDHAEQTSWTDKAVAAD